MQKFEQLVFKWNEYSFILVDPSTTDVLKHAATTPKGVISEWGISGMSEPQI